MNILLVTEGGERGEKDIHFLSGVITAGDHDVDLVYVKEIEEEMPKKHFDIAKDTQVKKGVAEPGARRRPLLNDMASVAEESGIDVEQVGLKGDPADQILARAEMGYDLVAMGSGGRGIFKKEMLGFVANKVVKESPVSVLVVKGEKEACKKVLVCTKGGEKSREVFRFTGELLGGGEFDITTLYVSESFPRLKGYMETVEEDIQRVVEDFRPGQEEYIDRGIELLRRHGLDSERTLREGAFDEQVLEEAKEGDYDLVVLGSHALEDWVDRLWKGKETVPIVRDLEESFLLVREREE